ncbi:Dabb family protein [Urechidicola croceus]|uniref:Stress responsive protein n=1 Tax=Urechidicola croceus TaxID=1850246 RepID=A0A1D8P590_9FLAO|nr:Dabb family protein [Urechidicola croceus]AOW19745.1 stress responsive protein [Urechidicola croceus]
MKKILLLTVTLFLTSCTCNEKSTSMAQGDFAHIVFFWLKNPDNQADRKAFEESLTRFINKSEFIKTMHVGTPAATNREVIDNSYTYCLSLTFENKAMQDKYQDEPNHKIFIEESSPLWEKVIVYDSENILK